MRAGRTTRPANSAQADSRRLGLAKMKLEGVGECAIVHRDAGDSAPFLPRDLYEALQFLPPFDALPLVKDHEQVGLLVEHSGDESTIP
jgi:hypothetical protein